MMNGTIFNIQKFCISDGPGIRTTVFIKGCPLDCIWCHNPESKSAKTEILFDIRKCIGCGSCAAACSVGCHSITEQNHSYDRSRCIQCGNCVQDCFTDALEKTGYSISVETVLEEVMKDEIFYRNSGGGLTVSGGEPMAQFDFTYNLLRAAKEKGLHTCMETCGYAPSVRYQKIAPLVDIFLFDYKLTDSDAHRRFTGVPNEKIIDNLKMLDAMGAVSVLRCPIIPTINDNTEHFNGIAQTANSLKHITEINIEPYHPLGCGKSAMLGKNYPLSKLTFPANSDVNRWIQIIQTQTAVPVKKG